MIFVSQGVMKRRIFDFHALNDIKCPARLEALHDRGWREDIGLLGNGVHDDLAAGADIRRCWRRSDGWVETQAGRLDRDLALEHHIALHELSPQHASLEEAFFELTEDSVEYRGTNTPQASSTMASRR